MIYNHASDGYHHIVTGIIIVATGIIIVITVIIILVMASDASIMNEMGGEVDHYNYDDNRYKYAK